MKYLLSVDIVVEDVRESRAVNSLDGILKTLPYVKKHDILACEEYDEMEDDD